MKNEDIIRNIFQCLHDEKSPNGATPLGIYNHIISLDKDADFDGSLGGVIMYFLEEIVKNKEANRAYGSIKTSSSSTPRAYYTLTKAGEERYNHRTYGYVDTVAIVIHDDYVNYDDIINYVGEYQIFQLISVINEIAKKKEIIVLSGNYRENVLQFLIGNGLVEYNDKYSGAGLNLTDRGRECKRCGSYEIYEYILRQRQNKAKQNELDRLLMIKEQHQIAKGQKRTNDLIAGMTIVTVMVTVLGLTKINGWNDSIIYSLILLVLIGTVGVVLAKLAWHIIIKKLK